MGPERRLTARRSLMVMPTSTKHNTLNAFLAVVVATTLVHGEADDGSGNSFVLPQRLVRREFLRFGKRSGLDGSLNENDGSIEGQEGMSEIYDGNSINDQEGIHEAKQRSFLRFGKRSENYLRFGKRPFDDQYDKKSENYLRFGKRFGSPFMGDLSWAPWTTVKTDKKRNEETVTNKQFDGISSIQIQPESWNKKSGGEPHDCTSFGDGYFVICRLNPNRSNRYRKRARDFLRFG